MKIFTSELYTLRKLPSVLITFTLAVVMAVVGASLHWSLPYLLKLDPPERGAGPAAEQVDALLAASDPALKSFQTAGLDITGSGQSSGISVFIIAVVALVIAAAIVSFSSGAVVWKTVASGNRISWALGALAAVAVVVLATCVIVCAALAVTASIAMAMHSVSVEVSAGDVAIVWLRGILSVLLLAVTIFGCVLTLRKQGLVLGVVIGVVVAGVILGTIGSMAGWNELTYSWLPTNAVTVAGGQGLMSTLNPWVGIGILAAWAAVSLGIGLRNFKCANL